MSNEEIIKYVNDYMIEAMYSLSDDGLRAFKEDISFCEFMVDFEDKFNVEDIEEQFFDVKDYKSFLDVCVNLAQGHK